MVRRAILAGQMILAAAAGPAAAGDPRAIAVFPAQNRTGDAAAAVVVDEALRAELAGRGRLVGPDETRDALRRLRIRNGDRAAPLLLRQLGAELGAAWLVSATVHDADRYLAPSLTLSVRVYSSSTGELLWAGFRGESGIDRRKPLGLGTIGALEELAPVVARDLLRDLPAAPDTAPSGGAERARSRLGKVAVVPFTGTTAWLPTRSAEAATEAARARFLADGVRLVSPNQLFDILRRLQGGRWGGVTAETRAALEEVGADTILTGTVEAYELGGSEAEPEPRVTVALRLIETTSGRILWTGCEEREGWDRQGLFRRGRVYSRGALAGKILDTLARRLAGERIEVGARPEGL